MSYTRAPELAWSGWRLRIPGGPAGGQYHGFIGPDSSQSWEHGQGGWPGGRSEIGTKQTRPSGHSLLPQEGSSKGPWAQEWGGTAFDEGQTHSDYVYRSPGETRPRPNASGGVNVVFGEQQERTAGYAEAPGNYKALGRFAAAMLPPGVYEEGQLANRVPRLPYVATGPGAVFGPTPPDVPIQYIPYSVSPTPASPGPTALVAQPPPPTSPGPAPTVSAVSIIPISPAPSPVVAASPSDYMPSVGQPIASIFPQAVSVPAGATQQFSASVPGTWQALYGTITSTGLYTAPISGQTSDTVNFVLSNGTALSASVSITPSAASTAVTTTPATGSFDVGAWLDSSSIWPGVPNLYLVGGAAIALLFFMGQGSGKKR